jgi:hypothetical protein
MIPSGYFPEYEETESAAMARKIGELFPNATYDVDDQGFLIIFTDFIVVDDMGEVVL